VQVDPAVVLLEVTTQHPGVELGEGARIGTVQDDGTQLGDSHDFLLGYL
jgi:hypothetical protein